MEIKDWNSVNDSNASIEGIAISENCPFANLNDAVHAVMGSLKREIADQGATVTAATLATISGASQFKLLMGGTTISGFDTAATGLYREAMAGSTLVLAPTTALGLSSLSGNVTLMPGDLIRARSLGAGSWKSRIDRANWTGPSSLGTAGQVLTSNGATATPTFQDAVPSYETGTFTPALKFGGGNTGMTGTFTGTYTKEGNRLDVSIRITLTAKGSSTGSATITGLPFTSAGTMVTGTIGLIGGGFTSIASNPQFFIAAGGTTMTMSQLSGTLTQTNFSDTSDISITARYQV